MSITKYIYFLILFFIYSINHALSAQLLSHKATYTLNIENIKDNVKRQVIPYNYKAKKDSDSRFNETKLTKVDIEELPKYLKKNIIKYKKWIID